MDSKVPRSPFQCEPKTMDTFMKEMEQAILKSLTRKSDQGKFWHQIAPESQKSQLIVKAIMDRLFWKIYDVTSAWLQPVRLTRRHTSNAPAFSEGAKTGAGDPPAQPLTLDSVVPHMQGVSIYPFLS